MASNIKYNIDETFPVPGQDNDTQVFRDNFTTIKSSLTAAYTEVSSLQANTAKTNSDNTFSNHTLSNAILSQTRNLVHYYGDITTAQTIQLDYENGLYQRLKASVSMSLNITNFPVTIASSSINGVSTIGLGKIRLELTGGTGQAPNTITFQSTGSNYFKKTSTFPALTGSTTTSVAINVSSATDAVIIDIWQHDTAIYLDYIGKFV